MKIELDIDTNKLIAMSQDYCDQLAKGSMIYKPVTDLDIIVILVKTGLMESGLIENEDGYWTIGRRDGEHVLIEYKPIA